MKIERRTLIGCALFVGGYATFTLLDVVMNKQPIDNGLITRLLLLAGAVAIGIVGTELWLRYKDKQR